MKSSSNVFDWEYFNNGVKSGKSCYTNYRWLPALTVPMARAIVQHVGADRDGLILDYGCAKGYLVKALRMLGYQAFGVDISKYAIEHADELTKPFVQRIEPGQFLGSGWDLVIAKDVLEHLTEDEIRETLRQFRKIAKQVFVVVPLGDGERFIIPEMEKDVTHKTRQTAEWWAREMASAGFECVVEHRPVVGIKENWTEKYPNGNAFITTRR
jgi:SAM-dependent methyltransferase